MADRKQAGRILLPHYAALANTVRPCTVFSVSPFYFDSALLTPKTWI
jgi:hypothetical protein